MTEAGLRKVLWLDAATCVASGALLTLAAQPLAGVLGLPEPFLFGAGVALFPIAAFIAAVAARGTRSPLAVGAVVVGNLGWAAGALWVVTASPWAPSPAGVAFALVQAVTVLGLSALETRGARALRS